MAYSDYGAFVCLNGERRTDKEDVVLDLFGGSGTTMVAAEKLGRRSRLMELDPRYCDVIIRRWEEMTGGEAVVIG